MNRRNFFGSLGALVAAPAVVRASSLMPIIVPQRVVPVCTMYVQNGALWYVNHKGKHCCLATA